MDSPVDQFRDQLNRQPVGGYQIRIILVCTLLLLTDGFDVQSIAYIAPVLAKQWNLPKSSFGAVFSAGIFGLTFGAVAVSLLADRFGHRKVLMAATLGYACTTLAAVLVTSIEELIGLRFVTGFCLGGVMPIAIGLASDCSPDRVRARLTTIAGCGYGFGAALAGLVSAPLLSRFGWQAPFILGALAPLVLLPFVRFILPESLVVMIREGRPVEKIESQLGKIVTGFRFASVDRSSVGATRPSNPSPLQLFREGYAGATLLIWIACFMNLIALYFLLNWLPTVMQHAGMTLQQSGTATGLFSIGGVLGGLVLSWLMDKTNPRLALFLAFLLASLCVSSLGSVDDASFVMGLCFLSGFFVIGGQIMFNAYIGGYYPARVRATGLGWALGAGRIGGILGPLLGSMLIAFDLSTGRLFLLIGCPLFLAAIASSFIRRRSSESREPSLGST